MASRTLMGIASVIVVLLSACTTTTAGGQGADRRVVISNETGKNFTHFYGSRATTDYWEEDITAGDGLADGEEVVIDFDDGSDDCIFDLKAVISSDEEMVKPGIDVCRVPVVTFQ